MFGNDSGMSGSQKGASSDGGRMFRNEKRMSSNDQRMSRNDFGVSPNAWRMSPHDFRTSGNRFRRWKSGQNPCFSKKVLKPAVFSVFEINPPLDKKKSRQ